jgi:multiple antibiotic resistance protein
VVLRNSNKVKNLIGKDGTLIVSKIAALLLAAYSLAMLRSGIFEAISFWKMTY